MDLTTNQEEKEFLDCFFAVPIKELSINVISKIIKEITNLRLFVGAIKDVAPEQIQFEAQTLVQNYPFLTLEEITLAFILFTQNKLMPLERILNYPNFSSLFISQIINSYVEYRQSLIESINNRKKPALEYRASPSERVEAMQYMISEVWRLLDEKMYYIILINDVFNYFLRTGKITTPTDEAYEASRYADSKYITGKTKTNITLSDALSGKYKTGNKTHLLDTFTREWFIKKYFQDKELQDILNDVTENDFK